jgi:hypothetical protein
MPTFITNCTLPTEIVNYVSSPNTRGTLDILWSCLATLFLCTWSVQHPNVPALQRPRTALGKVIKFCSTSLRKLKGMLATLLAPELLLAIAISDYSSAMAHTSAAIPQSLDGIEWSLTHAFYANMGGFVIQFTDDTSCTQKTFLPRPAPTTPILPVQIEDPNTKLPQLTDDNVMVTNAGTAMRESSEQDTSQSAVSNVVVTPNLESHDQRPLEETISTHSLVSATSSERSGNKTPQDGSCTKTAAPREIRPLIQILDCHLKKRHNGSSQQLFSVMIDRITQGIREEIIKKGASSFNNNLLKAHLNNLGRLEGGFWALDANQLLYAQDIGLVTVPNITREEIEDQSKGDALVKILAISQTLWQILQLLARLQQGLSSSHAEVVTMAYSFCTFWIYLLFLHKPQNISSPKLISAKRYPLRDEMWMLAQQGPAYLLQQFGSHDYSIPGNAVPRIAAAPFHPTTKGSESPDRQTMQRRITLWAGGVICGVVFGLVHCIAWNFSFPTSVEKLLWRIASASTSTLPILWCILGVMDRYKPIKRHGSKLAKCLDGFYDKVGPTLSHVAVAVYIIIRLFLIVETFRALCFLPPEVFQTTWANFLPHVAS